MGFGMVRPVCVQTFGSRARMADSASNGADRINERKQLGDVVPMGSGEMGRQGNPFSLGKQMMLAADFASIGGIGAGFFPPLRRLEARPNR